MITSGVVPARLLHHHRRVTGQHAQDHDFADPVRDKARLRRFIGYEALEVVRRQPPHGSIDILPIDRSKHHEIVFEIAAAVPE